MVADYVNRIGVQDKDGEYQYKDIGIDSSHVEVDEQGTTLDIKIEELSKSSGIEKTQEEYDALPEEEKKNGSLYLVNDGQDGVITAKNIPYDNSESGLKAEYVNNAIDELAEGMENVPPHAEEDGDKIGKASDTKFGHVILTNEYKTSQGSAETGTAASSEALAQAYNELNSNVKNSIMSFESKDAYLQARESGELEDGQKFSYPSDDSDLNMESRIEQSENNIETINESLGDMSEISGIGDGTVAGAVSEINADLSNIITIIESESDKVDINANSKAQASYTRPIPPNGYKLVGYLPVIINCRTDAGVSGQFVCSGIVSTSLFITNLSTTNANGVFARMQWLCVKDL